jgi:hypothetical protein
MRSGGDVNQEEGASDDVWCQKLDLQGEAEMFTNNGELNTIWALSNCFIPGGAVIGCLYSSFFVNRFGPSVYLLEKNENIKA